MTATRSTQCTYKYCQDAVNVVLPLPCFETTLIIINNEGRYVHGKGWELTNNSAHRPCADSAYLACASMRACMHAVASWRCVQYAREASHAGTSICVGHRRQPFNHQTELWHCMSTPTGGVQSPEVSRGRVGGQLTAAGGLLGSLSAPTLIPPVLGAYSPYPLVCLLYTSPSPRDRTRSRMPSSA